MIRLIIFLLFDLRLTLISSSTATRFFDLKIRRFFMGAMFKRASGVIVILGELRIARTSSFATIVDGSTRQGSTILMIVGYGPLRAIPVVIILVRNEGVAVRLIYLDGRGIGLAILFG